MKLHEELLLLSEEDVLALLTPSDAISAAEEVFYRIGTGDITAGDMTVVHSDDAGKRNFHSMPTVLHYRQVAGMKWISSYQNPPPGYPFSHGNLVILNDTQTASPIAIVGATALTLMRTAGGHGVVQAKHLCNPEPAVLSVFGCGAQARTGIQGFLTQFPSLQQIRIFSRSTTPIKQVRQDLRERVEVVVCSTPEEALCGSNLVLTTSGSRTPLLTVDMARPGMTIIGISGFRDLDSRLGKQADKWYVGYKKTDATFWKNAVHNPHGFVTQHDIFGDMTELLTKQIPGREREDELIVSTHMGMGAHDVACALLVYDRAIQQGIGKKWVLT